MFEVGMDTKNLEFFEEMLKEAPEKASEAMEKTMRRIGSYMKTSAVSEVTKQYTPYRGDVSKAVKVARGGGLEAGIDVVGPRISMYDFKTTTNGGIVAEVIKGKPHAFENHTYFKAKINRASKRDGIYKRKGKPRFPVKKAMGPSVPQMAANEEVREKIETRTEENFQDEMINEVVKAVMK